MCVITETNGLNKPDKNHGRPLHPGADVAGALVMALLLSQMAQRELLPLETLTPILVRRVLSMLPLHQRMTPPGLPLRAQPTRLEPHQRSRATQTAFPIKSQL